MKTQTFKQFELERLIKDGTVIPASRLAEAKDLELQRSRDFEASIEDEERHRKAATTAPDNKLKICRSLESALKIECGENCGENR